MPKNTEWEKGTLSPEEVLRKLKKLLKYKASHDKLAAKGELASAAEAAKFATKIQDLLATYKLSLAEVQTTEEEETVNPFVKVPAYPTEYGERYKGYRVEWSEDLADIIARYHYCRLLIVENTNVFLFLGRKTDAEIASYLFYRIARYARELCEKDRETARKRAQRGFYDWMGDKRFRESFYFGFSREIYERLEANRKRLLLAQAPLYTSGAGNCSALVRADKEVERKLEEESGGKPAAEFKDERTLALSAIFAGRMRGKEVSLEANALGSDTEPEALRMLTTQEEETLTDE